jgi:3-dehydroquinate dehydratase-2
LGERQPEVYGTQTLDQINNELESLGSKHGVRIECFQSNHEGVLIDKIHSVRNQIQGFIFNPAAYTHTSIALRDAVISVDKPMVEVHLSDITKREAFRNHSYFTDLALKTFMGERTKSYTDALEFLINHLKNSL